jgi:hypothetical protein
VSLAALAPAGMPVMLVRFVRDLQLAWVKALLERPCYPFFQGHGRQPC